MESTAKAPSAPKRLPRTAFKKGDPSIPKSPGRPKRSPEQRAAEREFAKQARRAVADIVAEARAISGNALDALEQIINDRTASEAARTSAARVVLDRAFGLAPQTIVQADTTFDRAAAEGVLAALRKDVP